MALYVLKPWNKWKGTHFIFSDQASIKKKRLIPEKLDLRENENTAHGNKRPMF